MQKLPSVEHTTVRSHDFERHTMGVAPESVNQVAFYLRDGIYSDNILACIREYTTNALDEHVKLKIDRPVEVRLTETEIKIRDYGLGLDKDSMFKVFGQLGMSGKRADNEQAGCFGIGSSAAFSYSESFTGVCVNDGIKSIYFFVLEEVDGCSVPTANLISEDFSDEPSGIEITIPIQDFDFPAFQKKATKLYAGSFSNIDFQIDFGDGFEQQTITFDSILFEDSVIVDGCKIPFIIHENDNFKGQKVKMGPVCYSHYFDDIDDLISKSILVEVPIGSIDLAISRESIKSTKRGTAFLTQVGEQITQRISELIEEFSKDPTPLDIFLSHQETLPKGNGWFKPSQIRKHITTTTPLEFMKKTGDFWEETSKKWQNVRLTRYSSRYYDHNTFEHILIVGTKPFGATKIEHLSGDMPHIDAKKCLYIKSDMEPTDIDECVRDLVVDLRKYDWPKAKRTVKTGSERTLRARISDDNSSSYFTEARWIDYYGNLDAGGFIAWATEDQVARKGYKGAGILVVNTERGKKFCEKQGFTHIDTWIANNKDRYRSEIEQNSKGVYFEQLPHPIRDCFDQDLIKTKKISKEAHIASNFITEKIEVELDKKAKKVQDLLNGETLISSSMMLLADLPWKVPQKVKDQIRKTITLL